MFVFSVDDALFDLSSSTSGAGCVPHFPPIYISIFAVLRLWADVPLLDIF